MFSALNPLAQAAKPSSPTAIFNNPAVQLGALNPALGLAAFSPTSALAAKSPALNIFNPAVNPQAALLQWNPGAAPTLALTGKGGFGKAGKGGFGKGFAKPFGKGFGKGFGVI
ncbi:MAG: hypothetical protein ACOY94_25800 [Bacillota bacterium]